MKKKVFNCRLIFYILFALLLFYFGAISAIGEEQDWLLFIGFTVIALLPIFCFFISPIFFVFEKDTLKIYYFFGFYEIIEWKSVKRIEKESMTKKEAFMHICVYHIFTKGDSIGKKAFFTNSEINATRKTKRLIREFWKKDFEKKNER